jgi:hypothetical protein
LGAPLQQRKRSNQFVQNTIQKQRSCAIRQYDAPVREELCGLGHIRNFCSHGRSYFRVSVPPWMCAHPFPENLFGRISEHGPAHPFPTNRFGRVGEHGPDHHPDGVSPQSRSAWIVLVARDEARVPFACQRHRVLEAQVDAVTALGGTKRFKAPSNLGIPLTEAALAFSCRCSRFSAPALFPRHAVELLVIVPDVGGDHLASDDRTAS